MSAPPQNGTALSDVGLVVAAGGAGRRFAPGRNKLLCVHRGLPLFTHCLRTFLPRLNPDRVVLVVPAAEEGAFRDALAEAGLPGDLRCVAGGATRTESVANGLAALPDAVAVVAIQDAARPDTSLDILCRCVESARLNGSGVAAHRVTDTIKIADEAERVQSTPERQRLWAAETPQVFRLADIRHAVRAALEAGAVLTDDAQALERLGKPVVLVENAAPNPKVTFGHDIES